MSDMLHYYLGWDEREVDAYNVCSYSCRVRARKTAVNVMPLKHRALRRDGLFDRPWRTDGKTGVMFDERDGRPFATQFAFTRFLVPHLHKDGWALFTDCDMLWQADIADLFDHVDDQYAVMVVRHMHHPANVMKMDHQPQSKYPRKNWSSVILWNCSHPANARLTLKEINHRSGTELHSFFWLQDEEIGALPLEWNYLVGHTKASSRPKLIHFTDGGPWFPEWTEVPYGGSWEEERHRMLRAQEAL